MTVQKLKEKAPGCWTKSIEGSVRNIPVHQLFLAWHLYRAGTISMRQLRIYFAAHEMAEKRRYTKTVKGQKRKASYTLEELKRFVGGRGSATADAALKADIKKLSKIGLVHIKEHFIRFVCDPSEINVADLSGYFDKLENIANKKRPVPVPRRMLRTLAGGAGRSATALVLALMIRSLYWHKEKGYRTDGRTKAAWITETFQVSRRAVTDGRDTLIELGWLKPLESTHWQINKWGLHDKINTSWKPGNDNKSVKSLKGEFATQSRQKSGEFASLLNKQPLPKKEEDLKTINSASANAELPSGILKEKKKGRGLKAPPPNIFKIQPEHLRNAKDLLSLYTQALEKKLIREGHQLEFFALAQRARAKGTNASAMFMWLLKKQKFEFITQAYEDKASAMLKELREGKAVRSSQHNNNKAAMGNRDHQVRKILAIAKQHRIDPAKLAAKLLGWSGDQWQEELIQFEGRCLAASLPTSNDY